MKRLAWFNGVAAVAFTLAAIWADSSATLTAHLGLTAVVSLLIAMVALMFESDV